MFNDNISILASKSRFLPDGWYDVFYSYFIVNYVCSITQLNRLLKSETTACDVIYNESAKNAQTTREINEASLEDAFQKAMAELTKGKKRMLNSCSNQGSGN